MRRTVLSGHAGGLFAREAPKRHQVLDSPARSAALPAPKATGLWPNMKPITASAGRAGPNVFAAIGAGGSTQHNVGSGEIKD